LNTALERIATALGKIAKLRAENEQLLELIDTKQQEIAQLRYDIARFERCVERIREKSSRKR
jgi:peptidoglycan hydrolase CwlO-like protein